LRELATSPAFWEEAVTLSRRCRAAGVTVPATGVLIYACATHHGAELEHADGDFAAISGVPRKRPRAALRYEELVHPLKCPGMTWFVLCPGVQAATIIGRGMCTLEGLLHVHRQLKAREPHVRSCTGITRSRHPLSE